MKPSETAKDFARHILSGPKCPVCGSRAIHTITYNYCTYCGWRSDGWKGPKIWRDKIE